MRSTVSERDPPPATGSPEVVEAERTGRLPTDLARAPFNKVAEDWLTGCKLAVAPKTYASDRDQVEAGAARLRRAAAGRAGAERGILGRYGACLGQLTC